MKRDARADLSAIDRFVLIAGAFAQ